MLKSALAEESEASIVWIRYTVLILLCCQNSGHALVTRYSQVLHCIAIFLLAAALCILNAITIRMTYNGFQSVLKENYSKTEVVLVAETIKLIFSGYLAIRESAESGA